MTVMVMMMCGPFVLNYQFKYSPQLQDHCQFLTIEYLFCQSMGISRDMVDTFSCIVRQTYARDCTLSDYYNALDDPVYIYEQTR